MSSAGEAVGNAFRSVGCWMKSRPCRLGLVLVLMLPVGLPAPAAGFGHRGWGRHFPAQHTREGYFREGGGPFRGNGRPRTGDWSRGPAVRPAPGGPDRWSGGDAGRDPRDTWMRDWRGPNAGLRNPAGRNLGSGAGHNGIFRRGFFLPPVEERRFVPGEVMLDLPPNVSDEKLAALAQRHHLTRIGSASFGLTGHTLYRWRVDDGRPVADVIRDLQTEADISAAQPNFTFTLQDQARGVAPREGDPAQYAVAKLHVSEAHHLATGYHVVVAVIDSAIDTTQPELQGVIVGSFDAVGGTVKPDSHGTAMAGAIAAHGRLIGVAPRVTLLAVRAFGDTAKGEQATTFNVVKALDWAVAHGARVINMSFAGPQDPVLQAALAKAREKGAVLVAAAGNAGPRSPPLYPAADPNVIAVTATDANDKLFAKANRGSYIALAAPGVDVLVPAPDAGIQLTSGTSVAAAEVSGIVALMLERDRSLTPDQARIALMATAKQLGATPRDDDFGAGLANAWQAVRAVALQAAEQVRAGPPASR